MAQPTITGVTLNAGSGGSDLAVDSVDSKLWQAILVGYSTGDGSANVVMADTGLPIVPATGATFQLAAGTAAIGKLAANAGVTIGAVEIAAAQTIAVTGTFWQATQPVSAASLPLPSGAATAAKQPALGTAGTASTDVISVQGIAGMTAVVVSNGGTFAVQAAQSGTWNIGTVTTVTTVSSVTAIANALPAGDNNIGNVDIVTLPSGNLGMQTMAASLSVVPASNITDATYIGDIKFGESLPAGTNAIGKLAANSGVDIGDVDVTSVVPGTGATSLGKARASALGATDTGVAALAVRNDDLADLAGADGDYTPMQVDPQGALYVNQAAAENKSDSGVAAGGAPGTDTLIAAVVGKKILVTALSLTATSVTTNNIYIDNVDNDLYGNSDNPIPLSLDADGDTIAGIVLPYNPAGWFKTDAVNEAVTLNTSAAQGIVWAISWIETD